MSVEKDQKKFFDDYAATHEKREPVSSFFFDLAIAELRAHFHWLAGSHTILEYGCGTGETIDLYLSITGDKPARIVGIDLSDTSIRIAKERHPHEFHVVPDNDLTFLPAGSIDAAYMIGVLHHTEEHQKIFDQIARVLPQGGKFLLIDLTKTNPLIEGARAVFPYMPKRIKQMFPDDLVIDETIPEKLSVDIDATAAALQKAAFRVEHIEYGHLFYFVFDWFERATRLNISRTRFKVIYLWIYRLERQFLKLRFFRKRAHLFAMRAVKTA